MAAAMQCPRCGHPMNHHADKPIEPVDPEQVARVDPRVGSLVEEMHSCPACGASASRPAS